MMSLSIDMTLHGVLLAGKWATESGLKQHDDEWWRNHLITKLGHTSAKPDGYYQGFNNDELIGKGAILVFLQQALGYDIDKLKTMSDVVQRDAIIEHNHDHTSIPIDVLQGWTNGQLVQRALDVISLSSMEMTLHGVLLAGKWTTESGLKQHDDEWWRNHLITKLGHTSAKPDGYYQGFNNDELIGKGAILVFLQQAGTYDIAKLKTMSDVDQRKAIIEHDNQHTGIPVAVLQGLSNPQLVRLALVE